MKRITTLALAMIMLFTLSACSNNEPPPSSNTPSSSTPSEASEVIEESTPENSGADESALPSDGSTKILIAYFSMPEDVLPDGVDAIAQASVVIKDDEVLGNTQYIAEIIQRTVGGDLFRIETVQTYPAMHDGLLDFASEELQNNARPELSTHVEDMDSYDVIFLGYPNWWADLPMPLYTFLEEYDLSGKTIIPFCPHGGSGFSRTESTIAELQPEATVSENSFTISRNNVANGESDVITWLEQSEMNRS
jgi:flavodoxin